MVDFPKGAYFLEFPDPHGPPFLIMGAPLLLMPPKKILNRFMFRPPQFS